MAKQVKVTVKQILGYLENGMTREEIAEELGITMQDCRRMFKHPSLKGKRTHTTPGFEFVEEDELTEKVAAEEISDASDDEFTGDATTVDQGEEEVTQL